MGFDSFMKNPKAYLGHHQGMLADAAASARAMDKAAPFALSNGKDSVLFTQKNNQFLSMIHTVGHGHEIHSSRLTVAKAVLGISGRIYRSFSPIDSNTDLGVRYLPFIANTVTYMRLDGNASFFLTGPLTGCTIAVAKHSGTLWAFHSNDNVGSGITARMKQMQSISLICTRLQIPHNRIRSCVYLTNYDGMGFVFGRLRSKGVWKFYSHATDVKKKTVTSKWAEIK